MTERLGLMPVPEVPALPETPDPLDERFWAEVRRQFPLAPDVALMNAANLGPSSLPVLRAIWDTTWEVEREPSYGNRLKLTESREEARRELAAFLGVAPEEIVITRNASESNNLISSGLRLGPGDEVLIHADNHPSNHAAWTDKARRFGFRVNVVERVVPHPGAERWLELFESRMTPRTRIVAFGHVSGQAGDLFPARELCRLARERGIATLVDAAQSFGVLDLDLNEIQPDFCTASLHKWACGPKEVGWLYIRASAQPHVSPSLVSSRAGSCGASRTLEAFGQRNEPAMAGVVAALRLQTRIGRQAIEARTRRLAHALLEGFRGIPGLTIWTHPDPARSTGIVAIGCGGADPDRLTAALYDESRIVCAVRAGTDRPGLRFSPHFYNLLAEVERTVEAVGRHVARARG